MHQYEVVVSSRAFAHPHQLHLEVNDELSGCQLALLLDPIFPGQHWFLGENRLDDYQTVIPSTAVLLSDLPRPQLLSKNQSIALKLFVVDGRDSGAFINLSHGVHNVGRCAPLKLSDAKVSRVHARVSVTDQRLMIRPEPGKSFRLATDSGFLTVDDEAELHDGSILVLGDTVLQVGEPASLETSHLVSSDQLTFKIPEAPELGRLLALCLASLVPILSGIFLALFTGSFLFLAISGLSASLGLIPAGEMLSQRRFWKRKVMKQQVQVSRARAQYASSLGPSLIAGITRLELGILPKELPPLVLGKGTWNLSSVDSQSTRRSHAKKSWLNPRSTPWKELHNAPVFAPVRAQTWQVVCEQDPSQLGLFYAILGRFIPHVASGGVSLVIDPSFIELPPEIMLLANVQQKVMAPEQADEDRNGVLSSFVPDASNSDRRQKVTTIYITTTPCSVDGAFVLAVNPVLSNKSDFWINPQTKKAKLPDAQMTLEQPLLLNADRLMRIVQRCVDLAEPEKRQRTTSSCRSSLQALVGTDQKHDFQFLDFDIDGPHVLICGTTGSGKSEALRRIVSDLAANYDPQQLALALIDFKGGAGLAAFRNLPQVQLFASDLDAPSAQRTLAQLEHEVARRERILSSHNCSDLEEYYKLPEAPMLPRLLIVIDEFRVFIESVQRANERIDRLAAVGRSLGMHLLLSTQRAAGAVSGQTRANINTIIALRVKDAAESLELVGSTAAANLVDPGSAIVARSNRTTQNIQFSLSVSPELHGVLSMRGPNNLVLEPVKTFGESTAHPDSSMLQELVQQIQEKWSYVEMPSRSFAEALPDAYDVRVESSPTDEIDSIFCGLLDNLDNGSLDPLVLGPASSRGLLVCGLPESGGRLLIQLLASHHPRVIVFGPMPVGMDASAPNIRCVTGTNRFEFSEALDFIETWSDDKEILVLVHDVANLCAQLDPRTFQRFDEVLMTLLRQQSTSSYRLVLSVDRDQNLLKATTLCAEQWYFPLDATEQLRMAWPKIPPCSQIVGRGIRCSSASVPTTFQLLVPENPKVQRNEETSSWVLDSSGRNTMSDAELYLGSTSFSAEPYLLPVEGTTYFLCPQLHQRLSLPRVLARRWNSDLLTTFEQASQWAAANSHSADVHKTPILCVELASTSVPELGQLIACLSAQVLHLALFIPPSPRLAFDLGVPGGMLDERHVVAVEAEHPQDLQPMNWPPLPIEPNRNTGEDKVSWRALAQVSGQLHAIEIRRD